MKQIIKCPICKSSIEREYYSGEWGLEEEFINCPVCHYFYIFTYGCYGEIVGNKTFTWNYKTKIDDPVYKRMRKEEFMAKRRWKKYRKGTNVNLTINGVL